MIIVLKEDCSVFNSRGEVLFKFPIGSRFNTISFEYIPQFIKDGWGKQKCEWVKKDYHVIFIQGKWVTFLKSVCEIPKAIGWRYNY